jgi:hypothetical protein
MGQAYYLGTLFYLATLTTVSIRPFRLTAGTVALAAITLRVLVQCSEIILVLY